VGMAGPDLLMGGGGNDQLFGYGGPDGMSGGSGRDLASGGPGSDPCLAVEDGVEGNDRVEGGRGVDRFNADPHDERVEVERRGACDPTART
jgi:Ca2+-binding RTX toxin-like protein